MKTGRLSRGRAPWAPWVVLGAGVSFVGFATPGAGQEHAARRGAANPLGAVVAEALGNNLGLRQERLLEEAAEARMREARGRYLPALTVDSRYTEQSGAVDIGDFVNPAYGALNQLTGTSQFPTNVSVTLPLRHESRLRLVQPVFNERIRAGWSAAGHAYESQRALRLASARALAADAQTAFLEVAAARSALRIWEATFLLVQESERVAERLLAAGTATPDAVFRARAERSDVQQRLDEAAEAERAASRAFNHVVGRAQDAPVDPVDESSLAFDLALTEEQAVERALAHREELVALGSGVESLRAGVRAATAGFLPEVSVALDYGFQGRELSFGRDHDFWAASLVVSWSLFNGGQDQARRHAALADADRLGLRRDDTEQLIRLETRQAYQAAVVARGGIETAEDRLAAAERSFELVRRRYEEGLASPVEFLDARTALTNAELNRVVTVYRYAVRWVDLERAAALLDISTLENASWN